MRCRPCPRLSLPIRCDPVNSGNSGSSPVPVPLSYRTVMMLSLAEEEYCWLNNLPSCLGRLFEGIAIGDPDEGELGEAAEKAEVLIGTHYLLDGVMWTRALFPDGTPLERKDLSRCQALSLPRVQFANRIRFLW